LIPVARLLVSVRSADEARVAVRSGAALIDVKEPDRGSLGRTDWPVWGAVRSACPPSVPVSVALGELGEWIGNPPPDIPPHAWSGLAFRKLGLAGAPPDWAGRWERLRFQSMLRDGPPWIAVAYADWRTADAPDPDAVLRVAGRSPDVAGILVDTWQKAGPFRADPTWLAWTDRVREAGLILALAGGLDLAAIDGLDGLAPDIVAVRGAACVGGDRRAAIDPDRVRRLARVVADLPAGAGGQVAALKERSRT
jgi:uncharacterized protein (UPF0264 family)